MGLPWKPLSVDWLLSFRKKDGGRDLLSFHGTLEGVRRKRDGLMGTGRYVSCWVIEKR